MTDYEWWRQQRFAEEHRAFLTELEPIVKARTFVYSMSMPRILVHADGRVERHYQFSPEAQKTLDLCAELEAAAIARFEHKCSEIMPT
jgi:hypothetical protein